MKTHDLSPEQGNVYSALESVVGHDALFEAFFFSEEQRRGSLREKLTSCTLEHLVECVGSLIAEKAAEEEAAKKNILPKKTPRSTSTPQGGKRARLAA